MANEYTTGMLWSSTLPDWQRDYYSMLLLETLRTKSILTPFCGYKEDFSGANSGVIIYTEVFDTEPNWNPLSESDIWLRGAHMDSRTVRLELEIHGDILKYSDYSEVVQYVKRGDMRGLVRQKIGQNQTDYLDLLARNAFFSHPNKEFSGGRASRAALTAADLFNPDILATIRVHLEENEIPGVAHTDADDVPQLVVVTSPRVIKDIRTANSSKWLELQQYVGTTRKFTGEVGSWEGMRFVQTNRMRLRNAGAVAQQTTLTLDAPAGSGAAQTVDAVYTVGQSSSRRYIQVADTTGFLVGQYITISGQNAHAAGTAPVEGDGTQETRRIVEVVNATQLRLNKPLLKPHLSGDFVTHGLDVHGAIIMGGPSVAYGVGERPGVVLPPKYDDLMMVNRIGWRGFLKFHQFRPEYYELVESAGSTD